MRCYHCPLRADSVFLVVLSQLIKAVMMAATNATGAVGPNWFQGPGHRSAVELVVNEFLPFFHEPDSGM